MSTKTTPKTYRRLMNPRQWLRRKNGCLAVYVWLQIQRLQQCRDTEEEVKLLQKAFALVKAAGQILKVKPTCDLKAVADRPEVSSRTDALHTLRYETYKKKYLARKEELS